jgi:FSR family fosmidomycin resistance protein-like MFS transporter
MTTTIIRRPRARATRLSPRARLMVMTAGHAVNDVYQGAVPALLVFLVADRQYSYTAAAGITLAATLLSSVAQPVFGVLTDRRGLGWLVPAGMATAGIGVGLSSLGGSYGWTWAAIALSGLGVAAYHPAASRAVRAAAGGSAAGMSYFAVGGNIGFALGPLLVTTVLATGGLAATPLLALPALLGATVIAIVLRPDPGEPGRAHSMQPATPDRPDDWCAFGWLTTVVVCRSITFFGLSSLLALHLTRQYGASNAASNSALTVLFAAGALGTLAGGRLADRYGRLPTVRIGYLLTLPGLALLVTAPSVSAAYAAVVVLGVGLYLPFSVHVTLGQEYLPARVGTASGVTLGLAVSVGGILAPLWGTLADQAGLRTALTALLVFPAASLLLSLRLPEPRPTTNAGFPPSSSTSHSA